MQIDNNEFKRIFEKIEHAVDSLGGINSWLPQAIHNAIDHAFHGHDGTLDRVDIDRRAKEREDEEKKQIEINSLRDQVKESQKQTKEMAQQTKYLFCALVITLFGSIFSIILQINPSLFGLLKNKDILKNEKQGSSSIINKASDSVPIASLSPKWDKLIKNLYVPSMYSDLCGFGSVDKCPEFSFINGELPEKFQNNFKNNADMGLIIEEAVEGVFNINNKKIDIIAVPYYWTWASSGSGIYIVKENNNRAEVFARFNTLKAHNVKTEINNNKIKISYTSPDNKNYSQTCFFKDNQLSEKFLQCDMDE